MDLSELFCAFLALLAKQNHDVWPGFQSLLKLLFWTKGVELVNILNALNLFSNVCICVCIWKQCRELRLMIALPGSVERSWSSTADWSFFSIALYSVLHFFSNALLAVLYFFTLDITFKCTLHRFTTPFNCTLISSTLKWVHFLLFNSIRVQTKYTISLVKYVMCRLQNKINTDYSAIFVFVYLCATCIVEGRSIQRGALIDDCFQLWRPAVICPMIDHTVPPTPWLTSTPNTWNWRWEDVNENIRVNNVISAYAYIFLAIWQRGSLFLISATIRAGSKRSSNA